MDQSAHVLFFDPDRDGSSVLPEAVVRDLLTRDAVLLLAERRAREDGWAARAAIAIAGQLAAVGRKVVLADLAFGEAVLHDLLGVANGEGVADVFLFGASPEHVAQKTGDGAFALIPAGVYVPDAAEVLAHDGWTRLLSQMRTDRELLLAYAPAEGPGLAALIAHIPAAIVLTADVDRDASAAELARGAAVQAVVAPPPVPAPGVLPPALPPVEAEPSSRERSVASFDRVRLPRDGERDALIADLRSRQRAALTAPVVTPEVELHPSPVVGITEKPPLTEPLVGGMRRDEPPRRRRSPVVVTLALVLIVSLLAGVWHFGRAYLRGRAATPVAVAEAPTPPAAVPLTGEPAGVPLPYSVAIEAHQDLPSAVRRVASFSRLDSTTGFYIAPILVDSALYYRVLAGPVRDSAAAAAMLQALIARRLKTGGSEWDIHATPYAFLLGEYELREQAEERMAQIRELDIPAYVLEVPYTNGPPRYYLYSGAYSGAAEAEVMRQLLRSAGLATNLVERTGRASS